MLFANIVILVEILCLSFCKGSSTHEPVCETVEVSHAERHDEVEGYYQWIGNCDERSYYKFTNSSSTSTHLQNAYIFFINASATQNFTGWVISESQCLYANILVRCADTASSPELVTGPWEERVGSLPLYLTSKDLLVTCKDKKSSPDTILYAIVGTSCTLALITVVVGAMWCRRSQVSSAVPQETRNHGQPTEQTTGEDSNDRELETDCQQCNVEPPIYTLVTPDVLPPYTEQDPHPLPEFSTDLSPDLNHAPQPHLRELENDMDINSRQPEPLSIPSSCRNSAEYAYPDLEFVPQSTVMSTFHIEPNNFAYDNEVYSIDSPQHHFYASRRSSSQTSSYAGSYV